MQAFYDYLANIHQQALLISEQGLHQQHQLQAQQPGWRDKGGRGTRL